MLLQREGSHERGFSTWIINQIIPYMFSTNIIIRYPPAIVFCRFQGEHNLTSPTRCVFYITVATFEVGAESDSAVVK